MKKLLLIFFTATLFISCQKKEKKEELKVCINMDPLTLDIRKNGDLTSCHLLYNLFCGLVEFAEDDSIKLALASSMELSDDEKTYTFHLKDNIFWSDNTPITAHDFIYSWKTLLEPDFPAPFPQLLYPIKNAKNAKTGEVSTDEIGVYAKDDKTLVIELENPCSYFLYLLTRAALFPIPANIDKKNPNWAHEVGDKYICNGPFKLKKWAQNNELIVEKNKNYWNVEKVKIDSIHYSIVRDESTAMQMFENGDVDWLCSLLNPLPLDVIPKIIREEQYNIKNIGGTTFCSFNIERFPFNNLNMRRAFGLAINREEIVKNITQTGELIATRCVPPVAMNGKNKLLYKDNQTEEAKLLFKKGLEELGIDKKDLKLTFAYSSVFLHKKISEALQETWQKTFGIDIKMDSIDDKSHWARMHRHDFQFCLAYWVMHYLDATNVLDRFRTKKHTKNYSNWENEEFVSLLEKAKTLIDKKERTRLLEKAEKIFIDDMPIAPIYHHNVISLKKPHVEGITLSPSGMPMFEKTRLKNR